MSYTAADQHWAVWIAWQLEAAGFQVILQAWDMVAGSNWTATMRDGIRFASRTIAVLSHSYLQSVYSESEWLAAVQVDPRGHDRKLIPVRVEDCPRPDLLGPFVSFDLFDRDEDAARETLLAEITAAVAGRAKPATAPDYPGSSHRPPIPPDPSAELSPPEFPGFGSSGEEPDPAWLGQPARRAVARERPAHPAGGRLDLASVVPPRWLTVAVVCVVGLVAGILVLHGAGDGDSPGESSTPAADRSPVSATGPTTIPTSQQPLSSQPLSPPTATDSTPPTGRCAAAGHGFAISTVGSAVVLDVDTSTGQRRLTGRICDTVDGDGMGAAADLSVANSPNPIKLTADGGSDKTKPIDITLEDGERINQVCVYRNDWGGLREKNRLCRTLGAAGF